MPQEPLVIQDEVVLRENEVTPATLVALETWVLLVVLDSWDPLVPLETEETLDHQAATEALAKTECPELRENVDLMVLLDVMATPALLETPEWLVLLEKMVLLVRDHLGLLEVLEVMDLLDPEAHPAPLVLAVSRVSKDLLELPSTLMIAQPAHQVYLDSLVYQDLLERTSS